MSLKVTTQIASLLIASALLVSCSSKPKATTTATTAATPAATTETKKSKLTKTTATKAAATAQAGSLVCKSGSDTRTLEVITTDGGCELSYTKFDQTSTPAQSGNGTAYCESIKEKIKGNLENSGFKCE